MNKFVDSYRGDIKTFLDSPGGTYFIQYLTAKETELWLEAAKAETTDLKAAKVDEWKGVYFTRDILSRWSRPKSASSTRGTPHSAPSPDVDIVM